MASPARIRTPMVQRWHRFRQQVLPVVCFIACGMVTLWLWERQARMGNVVGQIYGVRVDVTATGTGVLMASTSPTPDDPDGDTSDWELFDPVQKNDVIARLDDRVLLASLNTANAEVIRLRAELAAVEKTLVYDQAKDAHDHEVTLAQERVRRLVNVERLHLDWLERQADLFTDKVELERFDTLIAQLQNRLEGYQKSNIPVSDYELQDMKLQRNVVAERFAKNRIAYNEAVNQWKAAQARMEGIFSDAPIPPLVDELLTPLRSAIAVQEVTIEGLKSQIDSLVIRAPISGTIAAIHSRPGQAVQTGAPVVTIASNHRGEYIVSYIRQAQRLHPSTGMKVQLRTRGPGGQSMDSEVEHVGGQYENIPPEHLSDPAILERGLPVRIRLPAELRARPGEEIDIVFPPRQQQAS